MAVILETSLGDLTIDLYTEERPRCCKNFLKLCKIKYYNFCLFHSVQRNLMAQTGDPTDTGRGGESIYGKLYGDQAAYFEQEVKPRIKHKKRGLVSMVNNGSNMHGSQFFLTLGVDLDYLDGKHTVFGEVSEGEDILDKINEAYCDKEGRPFQDIRVFHTIVLDDPYDDPPGLQVPDRSPSPTKEQLDSGRIGVDEDIDDTKGLTNEEIEKMTRDREAKANAQLLEMVGDLPDAEMEAPDNVLFVCKLNPVTTSEDLEIIFSRFGNILSCEVIKDKKTEESLQYAFVEFEKPSDCESAYFKMDNVVIDDRRIHVDFSQSVSKVQWKGKGKGVVENEEKKDSKPSYALKNKSRQGQNYDLVYEENEEDSSSEKKKKSKKKKQKRERSRSRSRDRKPTVSKERFREDRKGSRSPERGGKRYREDERSPKRDKYSRRSRSPQKDSSRHKVSEKRSPSPRDRSRSPKERSRRSRDRSRSPKERSRRSRDRSRSPKERSRRSRDRSRSPRDKSKGSRVRSRSPKERERYREKDRAGERGDRDRAERRKR